MAGTLAAPARRGAAAPGTIWQLVVRLLRETRRQPVWLVVMLIQPMIWLWLFGQLFGVVVRVPGFGTASYLQFLTPGIVIMTALFSSAWAGMGVITEIDEGVMARLLTTPVARSALIGARVLHTAITVAAQSLIVIGAALVLGAHLPSGVPGAAALVLAAALLAGAFGALSVGFALLLRKEETLIAVIKRIELPLNFLSPVLMAQALMPRWMRVGSRFNPVAWAVAAGRDALAAHPAWGTVFMHLGWLAALDVATLIFATWTFASYRRAL